MQLYQETPISELPNKNGWYYTNLTGIDCRCFFSTSHGWYDSRPTHWLKPVDITSIIEEQDRWISIIDKQPKDLQSCIICRANTVQKQLWGYDKDAKCFRFIDEDGEHYKLEETDITHWQPLPEKPKQ